MQTDKSKNLQDIILGNMLRDPDRTVDVVATELSLAYFTGDNQKIYGAIMTLADKDVVIDILNVSEELRGEVTADVIAPLTSISGSGENIEYYIEELKKEYTRNHAAPLCRDTAANLEKGNGDSDQLIDDHLAAVQKLRDRSGTADESLAAIAANLIQDINYSAEHPGELPGISTGIKRLNDLTQGMQGGQFWILGAFTSVGKSALQQQITGAQAADGVPVAYLTLEMTGMETLLRITAQLQRTNMRQLRYPYGDEQAVDSLAAINAVSKLPIHIRNAAGMRIDQLSGIIRGLVRRHSVKVVYVDYVNLIPGTDRKATARYLELAEVSRTLKQIAIQLGICIVASAQLSKDAGGRAPTLRDIRESMNLAFDADIVLLLYRERKAEEQADGTAEVLSDQATLYVEKNRNGPTGLVKLYFHSGYVRFDETI